MHSTQRSHPKPSESRRYRHSPGGLLLPMHATLKGRVRWQVLDERGVPEVPRNPSGFAIGPVEGVEQDNLITDNGMDKVASTSIDSTNVATGTWRNRLAVGTGSVAPSVLDTALAAEAQRAASSGTFPNGAQSNALVGDVWTRVSTINRVVTMTADRNLTEFGFANDVAGDIIIRELFRDELGDPVTVSLLNGKSVLVAHTLSVAFPAPAAGTTVSIDVEEYDAANVLQATIPYDMTFGIQSADFSSAPNGSILMALWAPNSVSSVAAAPIMAGSASYFRDGATGVTASAVNMTLGTYTSGSYQRAKRVTYGAGSFTGQIAGFIIKFGAGTSSNAYGFRYVFSGPANYDKAASDSLRFGAVSTWARA